MGSPICILISCNIILCKIYLLQFHIFGQVKQIYQLQKVTEVREQHGALHAPTFIPAPGAPGLLQNLYNILVNDSCCTESDFTNVRLRSGSVQQLSFTGMLYKFYNKPGAPGSGINVGSCKAPCYSVTFCSQQSCLTWKFTHTLPKT